MNTMMSFCYKTGLVSVMIFLLLGVSNMKMIHAQSIQKATWLWNTTLIVDSTTDILQFAASQQINTIYLQINKDLDISQYQRFISAASAQHIMIEALDGAPSWALDQDRHQLQDTLQWITSYQQASSATEQFGGIHIDIEPYLLPNWTNEQATIVAQWQRSVQMITATAQALHLPASADIPFWLYTLNTPDGHSTLSKWMIDQYGSLTVMAYRDSGAAIDDVAQAQLSEADTAGKDMYIGVETNPSSEGDHISFYGKGADALTTALSQVTTQASTHSSFAGIAVHDYVGWGKIVQH
ncbi:hypothetical protein ACFSGI_17070 [Paenibacillus nicotianae]|uniref:Amidase n=1 Tax=Paenibacillus nicotianae TaxID=1526551 RepID=A0ABW4UVZ2_9BACL